MKNEKGPQKGQICEVIPSFFSCFEHFLTEEHDSQECSARGVAVVVEEEGVGRRRKVYSKRAEKSCVNNNFPGEL
jgi:hypothetical protein